MQNKHTSEEAAQPASGHTLKLQLREIGNRLKYYLEHRGLNLTTLQHHSGLNQKQLQKIIDGKKYPVKNLLPLLKSLQDMNGRWLIHGEGEMLKRNMDEQEDNGPHNLLLAENAKENTLKTANPEIAETLQEILNNQKKLQKQNRKIMVLLKAALKSNFR